MTWPVGAVFLSIGSFIAGIVFGAIVSPVLTPKAQHRLEVGQRTLWDWLRKHVVALAVTGFLFNIALGIASYINR